MNKRKKELKEEFDKKFPDLSNTEVWFWFEKEFTSRLLKALPKEREYSLKDDEQLWVNGYNQALKEVKQAIKKVFEEK